MLCPLCREQFSIPPGGLESLKKNFFIQKLLDLMKISKPVENSNLCDVCKANSIDECTKEIPSATMYCIECQENLCEMCCKEHKRQKLSRNHQAVPFGSEVKQELIQKHADSFCEQHSEKPLEIFCVDCRVVVCNLCFVESRKLHDCKDVKKVAENFRKDIGNSFNKMSACVKQFSTRKKLLIKVKENISQESGNLKREIVNRGNQLKDLVDRQTKLLVEELASIKEKCLKQSENEIEEMDRALVMSESLKMYCDALKLKGSPNDICRDAIGLQKRADELQKLNEMQVHCKIPPGMKYRFAPIYQFGLLVGKIEAIQDETEVNAQPKTIKDVTDKNKKVLGQQDVQITTQNEKRAREESSCSSELPAKRMLRSGRPLGVNTKGQQDVPTTQQNKKRGKEIVIFLRGLDGCTVQMTVYQTDPIREILLKMLRFPDFDLSEDSYRLIFAGRQLDINYLIEDYPIVNGSIIVVVMRLRGD